MKVKTKDLEGAALDYAVAVCEELGEETLDPATWVCTAYPSGCYNFSSNWSQGGPIIDREDIHLIKGTFGDWMASADVVWLPEHDEWVCGGTPIIAAMRAYVLSQSGDEVDIPEELMK